MTYSQSYLTYTEIFSTLVKHLWRSLKSENFRDFDGYVWASNSGYLLFKLIQLMYSIEF